MSNAILNELLDQRHHRRPTDRRHRTWWDQPVTTSGFGARLTSPSTNGQPLLPLDVSTGRSASAHIQTETRPASATSLE